MRNDDMGVFDFAVKTTEVKNEEVKKKAKSVFDYVKDIYNIIKNKPTNYIYKLDDIYNTLPENEYGFVVWTLNHNLAYAPKAIRENIDWFTGIPILLGYKKYVYWYVKFFMDAGIKFPEWMTFYKLGIGNNSKAYKQYLKDEGLDDNEINDLCDYYGEITLSVKDLVSNIEKIKELKGEN